MKVERGIEQVAAGLDPPKRLDQSPVDRGGFIHAEGGCSFAKQDVEPFLYHLITDNSAAGFMGGGDPFLCSSLFAGSAGITSSLVSRKNLPFIAFGTRETPPGSEVTDGRRRAPYLLMR